MVAPSFFVSAAGLGELRAAGPHAGRGALPAVGPVPVAERIAVVVGLALHGCGGVAARVARGGLGGGRLGGDEREVGESGDQGLHVVLSLRSGAEATALV